MKRRCFSAGWSLLLGGLLSAVPLYGGDYGTDSAFFLSL